VAYAVSGVARLALPEQEFAVRLDGRAALVRRARCVVVGNAGLLPGGFTLLPEARLDDGLLDVGILAPGGLAGWARVAGRVLTHRRPGRRPDRLGGRSTGEEPDGARGRGNGGDLEWFRARRVEVRAGTVLPRQIDGEVTTPGRTLNVSVRPGSLTIRLPK
jgi:diacylglycerol kinase family enzyme